MDNSSEILSAIHEIRELIRLIAEPAIAQRDQKLREELRQIVGHGASKIKAVLLMDGTRTQRQIQAQAGVHQGNLSTLVKELKNKKLLFDGSKEPKLAISIPANFFDLSTYDAKTKKNR
jgi:hypothetical protein